VKAGSARTVPATAPGRLGLVQRFLNSLHVERGTDELAAPETAYRWLAATGSPTPPPPGPQDLDRLRTLRRELRARCGDGSRTDEALRRLAASAPLHVAPAGDGSLRLTPAGDGHAAVLAGLLAIAFDAERDGTWARLKICHHDACRWAFYDESRSRTATWCAMGVCGNRTKAAAHRRRQQSSAGPVRLGEQGGGPAA
jgi:predicted RNA-binding Zn ribbon-like protein